MDWFRKLFGGKAPTGNPRDPANRQDLLIDTRSPFDATSARSGAAPIGEPYHRVLARGLAESRAQCRDVYTTTAIGKSAVRVFQNYLATEQIPHLEGGSEQFKRDVEAYQRWTNDATRFDYRRQRTMTQMIRSAIHHIVLDGEFFLRLRQGSPLSVELLDPNRIPLLSSSNEDVIYDPEGRVIRREAVVLGIRYNALTGRIRAYQVVPEILGAGTYNSFVGGQGVETQTVRQSNVLHAMDIGLSDSIRGLPLMSASEVKIRLADAYLKSAFASAEENSRKLGVLTRLAGQRGAVLDGTPASNTTATAESQRLAMRQLSDAFSIWITPPGTDLKPFDSKGLDAAHKDFVSSAMFDAAAGLGISVASLTGDVTGASYSSLRAGYLTEHDTMQSLHDLLTTQVFQPLWIRFLIQTYGKINANTAESMKATFPFRQVATPDPRVRASADQIDLNSGVTSVEQVAASRGIDIVALREAQLRDAEHRAAMKEITGEDAGNSDPAAPDTPMT